MEPLILILVGIFWIAVEFSVVGGIFMLLAGVLDFVLPNSPIVALPLLGAVISLFMGFGSNRRR